ncbi:MAG: pantetheine-phosphate adenylyltransferase [Lachnospiraceae bacterium]|nr:pantetheine-phosphate adenylyltransferase [Lachnospiraceae bacterium]
MSRAVFPGSFDPVTFGHIDLIKRAASVFDELIVGILVNSQKKGLFTTEEREMLISEVTKNIGNVKVTSFDGLLVDFVKLNEADVIIRGVRSSLDFEYELPLAQGNRKLYEKADTMFLLTAPEYSFISSSAVKELIGYNADISDYVPIEVINLLKTKGDYDYAGRKI